MSEPRLQYKARGWDPFTNNFSSGNWEDVPVEGLKSVDAEGSSALLGSLFLSSITMDMLRGQGDSFDLEIRIKPEYSPGFYRWFGNGSDYDKRQVRWFDEEPSNPGWRPVIVEEFPDE